MVVAFAGCDGFYIPAFYITGRRANELVTTTIADIEHALTISQQFESLLSQKSEAQNGAVLRRKALQLSKRLLSILEKPKIVAFESIPWVIVVPENMVLTD